MALEFSLESPGKSGMEEDPLALSSVGREIDRSTSLDSIVKLESEVETSEVESSESEVLLKEEIITKEEDSGNAPVEEIAPRRKPYVCKYCEEAFADRYSLKLHAAKHDGEKRFRCSECGKAFPGRYELTNHIRTHTGERPFVCDHCGRGFSRKSDLGAHIRTHTRGKPHQCGVCLRAFAQLSQLVNHTERRHPSKMWWGTEGREGGASGS